MATDEEWCSWLDLYEQRVESEDTGVIAMQETTEKKTAKTVSEEIKDLGDILLDDATGITWDLYRLNQKEKLDLKIRMALFPESVKVKECGKEVRRYITDSNDLLIHRIIIQLFFQYEIVESNDASLRERHVRFYSYRSPPFDSKNSLYITGTRKTRLR